MKKNNRKKNQTRKNQSRKSQTRKNQAKRNQTKNRQVTKSRTSTANKSLKYNQAKKQNTGKNTGKNKKSFGMIGIIIGVLIILGLCVALHFLSITKISLENGTSSESLTFVWDEKEIEFNEKYEVEEGSEYASSAVAVSSSDPGIAEITKDGKVTIHDQGDVTLTIRAKYAPWVKAKINLHVADSLVKMPDDIPRTEVYYLLHKDDPLQLQYDSSLADNFTFASDNESVVKVDASGNITVTGNGLASITATYHIKDTECTKNFNVKICTASDHTKLADHTLRWYDKTVLVAHALGTAEGYEDTNSKEGFLNSVEKGFKVLEVDLNLTSDKVLVCRHRWLNQNYDVSYDGRVPTLEEFESEKLYGTLTPLSAEDLFNLWSEYPDVYIMVDFKYNDQSEQKIFLGEIQKLVDTAKESGHEDLLSNIIVQLYHPADYEGVCEIWPFENFLITYYAMDLTSSEPEEAAALAQQENMGVLTMREKYVLGEKYGTQFLDLANKYNQNVFIHTVDYKSPEIWDALKKGVDGFYTNNTTPESLKQAFDMD